MFNYCNINDFNKNHIKNLIDWLYKECVSAGGDGDALWYSRFFDVNDILVLVNEYNDQLKYKWAVELRENKKTIVWWEGQQSIFITNDESVYTAAPKWEQCLIKY
jgi:hypothetical protein